jgi:glutamyl-tRNA(Gln) amidotransferase subunit E
MEQVLFATKIENYSGFFGKKEDSKFWLGKEIANLVKSRGFGGIIHSDEDLSKYQFNDDEIKELKSKIKIEKKDLWIMLIGEKEKIISVLNELVFPFLSELKYKNPPEVRNCLPDGTTEFLRPMPGSSRMYPETDLELLHIHKDLIVRIKKNLPKLKSKIEEELRKEKLRDEQIKILLKDKNLFKLYLICLIFITMVC